MGILKDNELSAKLADNRGYTDQRSDGDTESAANALERGQ